MTSAGVQEQANGEEYMKRNKIPALVENFLKELLASQPGDPTAFLAEWALKKLPSESRQSVLDAASQLSNAEPKAVRSQVIVITGPSGVGKGTLIKRLMAEDPGTFGFSVSHTTRYPRVGEVCGKDYTFIPQADFEKLIEQKAFIEYANVHGNFYGTSRQAVESVWKAGKCCILDIDVQGATQVHSSGIPAFKIFIRPPSFEELSKRLVGRGTESQDKVSKRLANARQELDVADKNEKGLFDVQVVNDTLDNALAELKKVIYK